MRLRATSWALAVLPALWTAADERAAHFETAVRPVLLEHCAPCHGPGKQKSGLRLDTGESLYRGGSRGPAAVPGDPASSLLMQAVGRTGELAMPPDAPLPPAAVEALRAWIADGAHWPGYDPATLRKGGVDDAAARAHWAFRPAAMPPLPAVRNVWWAANAIDLFVLEAIEAAGLAPAPPAEKATLLRRAAMDLTGLPPTPEALRDFLDDAAPDAYARMVDRLLESPQYGERWARHWLDGVRYTDSFDARASTATDPAEIWRYRDWVVRSINEDLPYDEFLRMQIAGDLLPAADGGFNRDGLIATGVLAIGNWPQGDADKEKMVCDIVDDQIDLIARGFLGLTVSCARCHDHKFEPFSTEDYYGLAGIFFSSSILPGPGAKTEGSPILHLPLASKAELEARAARQQRLDELRGQREGLLAGERAAFAQGALPHTRAYIAAALGGAPDAALDAAALSAWQVLLRLRRGTLDRLERDTNGIPGLHARRGRKDMPSATVNLSGKDQHYVTIDHPAGAVLVHPAPDAPALVAWRSPIAGRVRLRAELQDADPTCGNGVTWRLLVQGAAAASGAIDNAKTAAVALPDAFDIEAGGEVLLEIDPRGDYSCDSTLVSWQMTAESGETWDFAADVRDGFAEAAPPPGRAAVWRFDDPNPPAEAPAPFDALWPLLDAQRRGEDRRAGIDALAAQWQAQLDAEPPADEAAATLRDFLASKDGPYWLAEPPAPAGSARPAIDAEIRAMEASPPPALELAVGIQEGAVPNTGYSGFADARVHRRGDYNNLGDAVPRRMPRAVAGDAQAPIAEGSGRRELAAWVGSEDNPLTARVMVNRIWLHHFGEGIVRTPGDFGLRGEAPTHPALLDWLARVFMDGGWRMKPLHRLILNSAVYRQSAAASPETLERDPGNRLFARMNRRRLEAESLRDSLLAVSGRLDLTPGGPAYAGLDTPRRTLYLKTNRSDRTTFAMLFDAADPTAIVPRRNEATIAPQALFLMNHPFTIAAAEALAGAVAPHAAGAPALAQALYTRLYAREPTPHETALAEAYLASAGHPADPAALAGYCQTLLCANEFAFID